MPLVLNETIHAALSKKALDKILTITEGLLPVGGVAQLSYKSMVSRNLGRIKIVNRIRNGQVQFNKKVDVMGKGYKMLPNGIVVKMTPTEIRNRARAAKVAARKREAKMPQILQKRKISLSRRNGL